MTPRSRAPSRSSTPRPARGHSNIVNLPLVGRVAAGTPVLAVENVEEHLNVGTEIAGGDDSYALTVHGESMIDAGIRDGDIVVVRPRREAPANGTIVVARIENETTGESEVTVKRFFREFRTHAPPAGEQHDGADLRARRAP